MPSDKTISADFTSRVNHITGEEKMNKKKITQIICFAIMLFGMMVLSGCFTEEYDRADIIKYVAENIDVKKFSVSKEYEEVKGDDGYTDKVWTVTVEGDDKFEFVVHDDFHWGMEVLNNGLQNDYMYVALVYLYEKYDKCELLELYEEKNIRTSAKLVGSYNNLEELKKLFEEAEKFAGYVEKCGYDIEFYVNFRMKNPLRENCVKTLEAGDFNDSLKTDGKEDFEEAYSNAVKEYLLASITYRFEDKLSEFTEEEIKEAVEGCKYRVAVSSDGTYSGKFVFYDDLCGKIYTSAVTFGTLYEILVREEIAVTGDNWHYSFTGADGSVYEISYDFCDYIYKNDDYPYEEMKGYYYVKDGEKVPMDYYYYNYFREKEVLEMTGVLIDVGEMQQE